MGVFECRLFALPFLYWAFENPRGPIGPILEKSVSSSAKDVRL